MGKQINRKTLKYGTASTVITIVVIAALVIVNVILTSLGSAFGWYTDLTTSQYYALSDGFNKAFEKLTKEDGGTVNFNIVLMMDEDRFQTYNYQTLLVYNTLREVSKKYDNVNLNAINSTTYPELVEKYKFAYGDTISITDVVIELADENFESVSDATAKKYGINAFFTFDENNNLYGYNAEARLMSAFTQILGKEDNQPIAFYLQGHGEPTIDKVEKSWAEVVDNAGYKLQEINLQTENFEDYYDIKAAGDFNNCVVIINDPQFDLFVPDEGDDSVSEVKKIRDFLGTNYGNLIVAVDSTTPNLPALKGLLSEWGLGYKGYISDSKHSIASSEASKLTVDYSQMTDGMAASLKKDIFGSQSTSVTTVFESPAAVIVYDNKTISCHGYNGAYGSYPLLYPYSSATYSEPIGEYEEACYLGIAYSQWDLNDKDNTRSYVFVIGSTEFLSPTYANSCMNRKISGWMLSQIYDELITFEDIEFIKFTDSSALDVTDSAATAWTITTIVAIPVIALGLGTYVWIRRRHS